MWSLKKGRHLSTKSSRWRQGTFEPKRFGKAFIPHLTNFPHLPWLQKWIAPTPPPDLIRVKESNMRRRRGVQWSRGSWENTNLQPWRKAISRRNKSSCTMLTGMQETSKSVHWKFYDQTKMLNGSIIIPIQLLNNCWLYLPAQINASYNNYSFLQLLTAAFASNIEQLQCFERVLHMTVGGMHCSKNTVNIC